MTAEEVPVRQASDRAVSAARARDELRREVTDCRDALARLRATGAAPVQCRQARERMCDALEAYTLLLTESHITVPYSLRDSYGCSSMCRGSRQVRDVADELDTGRTGGTIEEALLLIETSARREGSRSTPSPAAAAARRRSREH